MTNEERQMIAELFERMQSVHNLDKDGDAEAFIHQSMRENADSPYLLVQSVLAQEVALQEAGKRIEELEAQMAGGRAGPRQSAGFSGNAVPAGQAAPWEAAVNGGSASTSARTSSGVWGAPPSNAAAASSPSPSAVPATGRAATSSVPASGRASDGEGRNGQRPNQPQRSGGFMAQAMTTAAGVAGGMLLANSIGSLFGGSSTASAATTPTTAANDAAGTEAAQSGDAQTAANDAGAEQDNGFQEATHDDGWGDDPGWGGDDDFGGDFEL